jgi:hypothetical protein
MQQPRRDRALHFERAGGIVLRHVTVEKKVSWNCLIVLSALHADDASEDQNSSNACYGTLGAATHLVRICVASTTCTNDRSNRTSFDRRQQFSPSFKARPVMLIGS